MINYGFGVRLRALDPATDEAQTFTWRNDYRIWRWCRQNAPLDPQQHHEWMKNQAFSKNKMFAICPDDSTKILGVCGLTSIDKDNGNAEFSLYIGPEHWRNGYGEMALNTLLAWGFRDARLVMIWGETFDGNPAAKLFEKVGMKNTGKFPKKYQRDGNLLDAHLWCMTIDEFQP